jgi:hypothetical protein
VNIYIVRSKKNDFNSYDIKMSLCGECNALGNVSIHTCSVDGEHWYCVKCIWQVVAQLPVVIIALDDIRPRWYEVNRDGVKSTDPDPDHKKRISEADLNYPIVLTQNYTILDGCHRLVKAATSGESCIKAVIVSPDEISVATYVIFYP